MKIAVITTGGTIGCVPDGGALRPSADIAPLLEAAARCGAPSAEYDVLPLMNVLSENLGGSDIVRIAEVVTAALASSDGAVVTHGTDTLDVTAAALAFALGSECAPVALASAFRPLSAQDSDAPLCFAACAAVAASGMRGVYACSASGPLTAAVHYGVRLLPFAPYSDALYSLGGHAAHKRARAAIRRYVRCADLAAVSARAARGCAQGCVRAVPFGYSAFFARRFCCFLPSLQFARDIALCARRVAFRAL